MPNWTAEQLRAIEARGGNILLSAAAGSGKTTVLVERVLRLIVDEGADVDRMLVVTFTRAAASDMRMKLSRQLNERAAAGDERCRDQLLKLDLASISTLHAFCADFLRVNFEAAGVDPAFRILDDAVNARMSVKKPTSPHTVPSSTKVNSRVAATRTPDCSAARFEAPIARQCLPKAQCSYRKYSTTSSTQNVVIFTQFWS